MRATERVMTYCIVPAELAEQLHEPLRKHFADERSVEVIVERRGGTERRAGRERRRAEGSEPAVERRTIRAARGRRVAERRARMAEVEPLPLPRRARRHAERIVFVCRLEPSGLELEDRDTARVVARFQAGDRDAFSTLYARYYERVYSHLRLLLNDFHEAEDAAQEVFVNVLETLKGYERREQPFRAWLFTVVRNRAMDVLRRQGRIELEDTATLDRRREAADEDDPLAGGLDWIVDRDLSLFVERLPLAQRQVLVLRYVLDLTYANIASVMNRTEVDVRSQHHRAVEYLRERLGAVRAKADTAPNAERRSRSRAYIKQAPVLRSRRYSLDP